MKESNIETSEEKTLALIKSVSAIATEERREKLNSLERAMLKEEQVDIPVNHRFSGGIYAREITIPQGTLLTGRIHKFDHFDIMLSGDITVSTDNGEVKRLTGQNIMEAKAGKKRAAYAHENTRWVTFHSVDERDPEEMYEFLTCASFQELEEFNVMLDHSDYRLLLQDMNMTEEQVRKIVDNEIDMIDFDDEEFSFLEVKDSKIQGKGLFTSVSFKIDDLICPSRIKDKRTIAGRYVNHSLYPNCKMVVGDGFVSLVAKKCISASEELTVNYREVFYERISKEDL